MEIVNPVHHPRQRKVHGAQAEDGEHIRRVDNKNVERDGQDRGDRIDRKNNIGGLDHEKGHQQRGCAESFPAGKEVSTDILFGHRESAAKQPQNKVLLGMDFRFALPQQSESRINQHRAEDVSDPAETVDQAHARHNEHGAHEEGPQNSPKENFALSSSGTLKYRKMMRNRKRLSTLSDSSMT